MDSFLKNTVQSDLIRLTQCIRVYNRVPKKEWPNFRNVLIYQLAFLRESQF